jgi:dTDP-4-dehydrorhamnose reductase
VARAVVLGARGMLGSMVAATLPDAVPADRDAFEAGRDDVGALLDRARCGWIVNAIGVLAPDVDERDRASVERAMAVNARFPHALAAAAAERDMRVVHVTTDGVFSGRAGPYAEDAPHDARDAYAASKSAGEVDAPHVVNLRCSIVGPERPPGRSLMSWLRSQPRDARVPGFANHRWNGLTTLQLARLCGAIVREAPTLPRTLHLVPADVVTKADLLGMLADVLGRTDLTIVRQDAPVAVDRSLRTLHSDANELLWQAAGYPAPPTVGGMVSELAETHPSACVTSSSSSASAPTSSEPRA